MNTFQNEVTNLVNSYLVLVDNFTNDSQSKLLNIQVHFIVKNYNTSEADKKINNQRVDQYVRNTLIGISGQIGKIEVVKNSLAENDIDEIKSDLKIEPKRYVFKFFNTGNVNRITQVCNNKLFNENLKKFLKNRIATCKLVLEFLKENDITLSSQLNDSCQKDGKFSNNKKKIASGEVNQNDNKKDTSIQQELKVESKNLALKFLADNYPTFYKLNSQEQQLIITELSNCKNLKTTPANYQIRLKKLANQKTN